MQRLCGMFSDHSFSHSSPEICIDEVIELIFYELDDPTALTLTSKHFHNVSQDPYVRAHYFLNRYGRMDAMFWALGRGKIMSDKVIDVCHLFLSLRLSASRSLTDYMRSLCLDPNQ